MSGFSPKQIQALRRKLTPRYVRTKHVSGGPLDYIEGWFAIKEANLIFGFGGWDRETLDLQRVYECSHADGKSCGYLARVRISVRAGDATVIREGTGWGSATAKTSGEAHEHALKTAETDATKRALATFGNRFGLSLYGKERNGRDGASRAAENFSIHDANGAIFAPHLSAETFCSALRQMIETADSVGEVELLWSHNRSEIDRLKRSLTDLKTAKGEHYSEILARLAAERKATLRKGPLVQPEESEHALLKPSRIAAGGRVDKSVLSIGAERRLRDKAHLSYVGTLPCLICGRTPSHAHHLKFAQKTALSMKVSDEFTVPLCAMHHDECHRSGDEELWWRRYGIAPLKTASDVWAESRKAKKQSSESLGYLAIPTFQPHESGVQVTATE